MLDFFLLEYLFKKAPPLQYLSNLVICIHLTMSSWDGHKPLTLVVQKSLTTMSQNLVACFIEYEKRTLYLFQMLLFSNLRYENL